MVGSRNTETERVACLRLPFVRRLLSLHPKAKGISRSSVNWFGYSADAGRGNLCAAMFILCGLQVNHNERERNRVLEDAGTCPEKWTVLSV